MGVKIKHKTEGWIAATTWSTERAELWLSKFNPKMYTDKTLKVTDFEIVE